MTRRVRRVAGTAIVTIVVLATAAACKSDPPEDNQSIPLPARGRRDASVEDVVSNVLQPVDGGGDTGAPADPFCDESGLVLCFTFDGAIENLVAPTPKLVPATVSQVQIVPGKKGDAARFDSGSIITFDYSPLLESKAATVEAWVNRDLTTFGDDTVFDNDGRFAMTVLGDGTLRCNTDSAIGKGGKIGIEQWVHIACVFDGTTIKGYVDGVQVLSVDGKIGSSSTTAAAIGDDTPTAGAGFSGEIDSFRFFSVARSAAQIADAAKP